MVEVTLINADRAQFQEKEDQHLGWEVNDNSDLKIVLDDEYIAFYPAGQWKYVVELREEFHKYVTTSGSAYIINYQLFPLMETEEL